MIQQARESLGLTGGPLGFFRRSLFGHQNEACKIPKRIERFVYNLAVGSFALFLYHFLGGNYFDPFAIIGIVGFLVGCLAFLFLQAKAEREAIKREAARLQQINVGDPWGLMNKPISLETSPILENQK